MNRLSLLALALASASAAFAGETATPEGLVRDIYAAEAPFIKGTGEGIMGDKAERARFFSAGLLRKIVADEAAAKKRDEAPKLEGDPFVDAQEATVNDLKISVVSAEGSKASVLADFDRGAGEREQLTYSLILEKGQWRVDDIAYARANEPASTLRGLLK